MQSSVAKNAPQRTISAPASAWLYRDLSCHIVFVIVDVQPQGPANVVLNQLSKGAFAMESAFRAAQDVVAVRQKSGVIGGRVWCDIKDVPNVCGECNWRVLKGKAKRGAVAGDGDVHLSRTLTLPDS